MITQTAVRRLPRGIAIACLFAATLTPLIVLPELMFPFVTGKVLWFRLCIIGALIFSVGAMLLGDRIRVPGRLAAALGALLLVHTIIDLFSYWPERAVTGTVERQEGLLGLIYFVVATALGCALLRGDWLRRYVMAMVLVASVVACSGLYTAWHWWPHKYGGGLLGNPGYLGIYCAMHVPLAVWLVGRAPLWWAWAGLINVVAVLATQSRAAWLALLIAMIAVVGKLRWTRITAIAVTLLALAIFWMMDGAGNERWAVWGLALEAFHHRPWTGYGHEHFEAIWHAFGRDLPVGTRAYDRAHNWVLDRLIDGGLVGLAAWVWLIYETVRLMQKAPAGDRGLLLGSLAAYLTASVFWFDVLSTTISLSGLIAIAASEGRDVEPIADVVLDGEPALDGGASAAGTD